MGILAQVGDAVREKGIGFLGVGGEVFHLKTIIAVQARSRPDPKQSLRILKNTVDCAVGKPLFFRNQILGLTINWASGPEDS